MQGDGKILNQIGIPDKTVHSSDYSSCHSQIEDRQMQQQQQQYEQELIQVQSRKMVNFQVLLTHNLYDNSFEYDIYILTSLYIQLNEAKFIATNIDRYLTTQVKDRHMPAGGSIVNCISYGTQVQPIVIGKPQQHIFDVLREEHGLLEEPLGKFLIQILSQFSRNQTLFILMVGDSLITDIRFGNNCGISTLCVLSGNTTEAKIKEIFVKGLRNEDEGLPTYVSPYFGFNS